MTSNSNPSPAALRKRPRTARQAGPRRERGSILIFVIGVLVLLAIIATAFLVASRDDRTAAQQNSYNTQIDLLLQGMINATKATVVEDVFDVTGAYRPSSPSIGAVKTYEPWDSVNVIYDSALDPTYPSGSSVTGQGAPADNNLQNDLWLSSRVPALRDPTRAFDATLPAAAQPQIPANGGIWYGITGPIIGDRFDSPYRPTGYTGDLRYATRTNMIPTSVQIGGTKYPAFLIDTDPSPTVEKYITVLAGDADGDGIADGGLFKIPVGEIAGVTYYAAVRVIDNNSAVNINTAMSREKDYIYPDVAVLNSGFFQTGVGLHELFRTYDATLATYPGATDELNQVNSWRLNPGFVDGLYPQTNNPKDDTGTDRMDFKYVSIGDLISSQIGTRPYNPGNVTTGVKGQSFSPGDAAALAFKFTLAPTGGSSSEAENRMRASLVTAGTGPGFGPDAPTSPFAADRANATAVNGGWFARTFDYSLEPTDPRQNAAQSATWLPRRALLTGSSTTANVVSEIRAGANSLPLITVTAHPAVRLPPFGTPIVNYNPSLMAAYTADGLTDKVSVNAGSFGDLWRAYWSVMAEPGAAFNGDGEGTIFSALYVSAITEKTASNPNYYNNPYVGREFYVGTPSFVVTPPPVPVPAPVRYSPKVDTAPPMNAGRSFLGDVGAPEQHPLKMFASPIRATHTQPANPGEPIWPATTVHLTADQVVLLRSAIAAVNTESLRDPTENISYRDIRLQAQGTINGTPGPRIRTRIYGLKKQPFITEIFVQTDNLSDFKGSSDFPTPAPANPNGYIAIELYNPYDVAIDINQCKLATIDRLEENPAGTTTPKPFTYPSLVLHDTSPYPATVNGTAGTPDVLTIDLGDTTGTAASAIKSNMKDTDPANPRFGSAASGTNKPSPTIIPPHGTLILENYDADATAPDATAAKYRPNSSGLPITGPLDPAVPAVAPAIVSYNNTNAAYVRNLHVLLNREFVLLRPYNGVPVQRTVNGFTPAGTVKNCIEYSVSTNPNVYDLVNPPGDPHTRPIDQAADRVSVMNMAPLDSYDLSGLVVPGTTGGSVPTAPTAGSYPSTVLSATAWHYVRSNSRQVPQVTPPLAPVYAPNWRCVYPGRYDANQSFDADPATAGDNAPYAHPRVGADGPLRPRQQGTDEAPTFIPGTNADTWDPLSTPAGIPPLTSVRLGQCDEFASYPTVFSIQLGADGWPGTASIGATGNNFPFAHFARSGDALQVPFIGSYRMIPEVDGLGDFSILEMNSVSMDASFAEDTDDNDDPTYVGAADTGFQSREQVGRFAPLQPSAKAALTGTPSGLPAPFLAANSPLFGKYNDYGTDVPLWRYRFSRKLFDYVSVQTPNRDSFPNVSAFQYGTLDPNTGRAATQNTPLPIPVSNSGATAGNGNISVTDNNQEKLEPVHGLININTAPHKVMAMVPWVPYAVPTFMVGQTGNFPALNLALDTTFLTQNGNNTSVNPVPGDYLTVTFLTTGPNAGTATVSLGGNNVNDNDEIARAIVLWRDGNPAQAAVARTAGNVPSPSYLPQGPFVSVYDIYRCPIIRAAQALILGNAVTVNHDPDDSMGDLSPFNVVDLTNPTANVTYYAGTFDEFGVFLTADKSVAPYTPRRDGVRYDFEESYLVLNRVSNLIAVCSDSFTAYVLVQGWRNVGTDSPELVVERRGAFLADRSNLTPTIKELLTTAKVPVQ